MKLMARRVNLTGLLLMAALSLILLSCPEASSTSAGKEDMTLTGTVTIVGVAQVGQTLTVDTFYLNGSGSLTYQWYRGDSQISGAVGGSYTLTEADREQYIKVAVKRNGYNGVVTSSQRGPVVGNSETPIDAGDPPLTGAVTISGIAQVGQTLVADTTALDGEGSLSYQWYRGSNQISGAAGNSYTLTEADKNYSITVWVKRSGHSGTVISSSKGPVVGSSETPVNIIYGRELWGEWIRMDNGDVWYFNNESITINDKASSSSSRTIVKESEKVIKVTDSTRTFYLYASRPATSSFSGRIADIRQQPLASIARSASIGGIGSIIDNIKNPGIRLPIETDPVDGSFVVDDIIAGDEYQISFPDEPDIPPVKITPGYSGDDIGTITITEGVSFKVSIKPSYPQSTDMTMLYADNTFYDFTIEIANTGTAVSTAAFISVMDFDGLIYSPQSYDNIIGSIYPGVSKSLYFSISCAPYTEDLPVKDKVIGITIKDVNGTVWEDSVQLQFHKAPVDFNVRSNKQVQGVIITPSQKAYHFLCDSASSYSATVTLPWTTEPYLIVFSGALLETETRYSFGINTIPDTDFLSLKDPTVHEPNNTEITAYEVDVQNEPKIMSYLHENDIDYFRIDLGPTPPPRGVVIEAPAEDNCTFTENSGNSDGMVNPGETAYLKIKVKNTGYETLYNLQAQISGHNTSHLYIPTLYNVNLTSGDVTEITFNVTVYSGCPTGAIGPLTLTLSENSGKQRKWWDTVPPFTVYILPPTGLAVTADTLGKVKVSWSNYNNAKSYNIYHSSNTDTSNPFTIVGTVDYPDSTFIHNGVDGGLVNHYKVSSVDSNGIEGGQSAAVSYAAVGILGNGSMSVSEYSNCNYDGKINPGETAKLSMYIKNPGTTAISNVQASLSGFGSNMTVSENNKNLGTINGNYTVNVEFILDISTACPTGSFNSLVLTLTESGGQYRTFQLAVPAFDITIRTPENVQASADSYGSLTVTWNSVSGSNVKYNVYASETSGGTYTKVNSSAVTETTYTHTGLGEGQTRYYKVSAVDSGGNQGLQSAAIQSPLTWYTFPVYNDLYDCGSITSGTVHYYRFPVINGIQYTITWSGAVYLSAYREDGTGTAWFTNSYAPTTHYCNADFTGNMVFKVQDMGYSSTDYSIKVDSSTQAINSFGIAFPAPIGTINGTINHTDKTIDILVPHQTNVSSLTPIVSGSSGYASFSPGGAQSFVDPRKYVFTWNDGSKHTYTVTVTALGQGDITIIPPNMIEDETVGGFAANITVSKTGATKTHQLQAAAGYASYEWYVDGIRKTADAGSGDRYFTIKAADYAVGKHTLTIIVWKNGRPYSNEQSFTVSE